MSTRENYMNATFPKMQTHLSIQSLTPCGSLNTPISWTGSGNWIFKTYLQTLVWLQSTCPVSPFNLPRAVIEVAQSTGNINSAANWRPSDPKGLLPFASPVVLWLSLGRSGQASWFSLSPKPTFIRRSANGLIDLQRPEFHSALEEKSQRPVSLEFSNVVSIQIGCSSFSDGLPWNVIVHKALSLWVYLLLLARLPFARMCFEVVSLDLNTQISQKGRKKAL